MFSENKKMFWFVLNNDKKMIIENRNLKKLYRKADPKLSDSFYGG